MIKNQQAVPYSRKEKSLGELSKKFLRKFGRIDDCIISLEQVVIDLGSFLSSNFLISLTGVERRRIYDIINILESLGVIYR
jgi:transcription factor E2F7/8